MVVSSAVVVRDGGNDELWSLTNGGNGGSVI